MIKQFLLFTFLFKISFLSFSQQNKIEFKKEFVAVQAKENAQQVNKKIFIDFYTTWCAPCKTMDKEVFTDKNVVEFFNSNFISYKIDAESTLGMPQAKRFKVKAYPTFVILDAQEKELLRMEGASSASLFLENIEKGLDENRTPEALALRYKNGERTPYLINDYAFSIMQSGNEDVGYKIIDDYFQAISKSEKTDVKNVFLYDRYSKNLADYKIQYLLNNKTDFEKSLGLKKTNEVLYRFLRNELVPYANGNRLKTKTFNDEEYSKLLKQIKKAKLSKEFNLQPLVKISNAKISKNNIEFLNICNKVFPSLTKSDRFLLMLNFSEFNSNAQAAGMAVQLMNKYSDEVNDLSKKIFDRIKSELEIAAKK